MKFKIPVYKPSISEKEKVYVNECLNSTWISSKGEFINKFEKEFSNFINIRHAITVANGTVALHTALLALGIGQGDEVIVPTLTYIASVNSIYYTGARPVFVDCDKITWQISVKDIEKKVTNKTKAIMAVHLYGNSCEMYEILKIAKKYNLFVIEDCAEAIGTVYDSKHVGTFGDISTFSFFGNKTITCGEGGMVCTNNVDLYKKAFKLKGQGLTEGRQYWHDIVGYNYRMTNICAAIGLAQLEKAKDFIEKKIKLACEYKKRLEGLPLDFQQTTTNCKNSYWMFSILVSKKEIRDLLMNFLADNGIETRPVFFPVHTMPMYKENDNNYPNSMDISLRGINLPSFPDLTIEEIDFICMKIKEFLKNNG